MVTVAVLLPKELPLGLYQLRVELLDHRREKTWRPIKRILRIADGKLFSIVLDKYVLKSQKRLPRIPGCGYTV